MDIDGDDDVVICESTTSANISHAAAPYLPPCRVCGYKSSGFHYGHYTCEACKAFFRRSINRTKPYKCSGKGECELGPNQRNLCPNCRLRKCLEIGMSKKAVRIGRCTHEHRTQTILEVKGMENGTTKTTEPVKESFSTSSDKQINHNDQTPPVTSCEKQHDQTLVVTSFKRHTRQTPSFTSSKQQTSHAASILHLGVGFDQLIQQIVDIHENCMLSILTSEELVMEKQKLCYEEHQLKLEIFGSRATLSKDQYDEIYLTTGIDIDNRNDLMRSILKESECLMLGFVNFFKDIPLFSTLTIADKTSLFKSAVCNFFMLECFRGYSAELEVCLLPSGTCYHKKDVEKLFEMKYINAEFDVAISLLKLNLKQEEIVILLTMSLLFTDECELQEPKKVEDFQWKLAQCLLYLLEKNHEDGTILFPRIIDRLSAIRELKEYQGNLEDMKAWPALEMFPLCSEILLM